MNFEEEWARLTHAYDRQTAAWSDLRARLAALSSNADPDVRVPAAWLDDVREAVAEARARFGTPAVQAHGVRA